MYFDDQPILLALRRRTNTLHSLCAPSDSGARHIFVAGGDADHIAVAIDSRITEQSKDGLTAFNDHHCKIIPLGDKAVFFFHGVNGLITADGHTIFDAGQIAQRVYNENPTRSFHELASL